MQPCTSWKACAIGQRHVIGLALQHLEHPAQQRQLKPSRCAPWWLAQSTQTSACHPDSEPLAVQDIWMHCIVMVVSLATAAVGIVRLVREADFKQIQTISILVGAPRLPPLALQ